MFRFVIVVLCYLFFTNGYSQEDITIGKTRTIESNVLQEERTIAVWVPEEYNQNNTKYPVIYLLDGEWNFHFVSAALNKLSQSGDIPPIILIGVINNNRNRDLTPPGQNDNPERFGGAERFLKYLTSELQPWVEANYRTQPYKILAGHSFGGLFTIYSMIQDTDAFQAYISLSPSLGRNNEQQVKRIKDFFSSDKVFPESLYLAIGQEGGYTQVSSKKADNIIEKNLPSTMRYRFEHLMGESHVSITTTGFLNGLKFIYEGYNAEKLNHLDEVFLMEEHFENLSKRYVYKISVPETKYREFVQEQIAAREYDYALFILSKYTKTYPNAHYPLYLYATIYLEKGNFKKAKEYYSDLIDLGWKDENIDAIWNQLQEY